MKKITKNEQLELIKKSTKEITSILDFIDDDKLTRIPTIVELKRWHIEINRGILLAKSKVHREKVLTLSDCFMKVIERILKMTCPKCGTLMKIESGYEVDRYECPQCRYIIFR